MCWRLANRSFLYIRIMVERGDDCGSLYVRMYEEGRDYMI